MSCVQTVWAVIGLIKNNQAIINWTSLRMRVVFFLAEGDGGTTINSVFIGEQHIAHPHPQQPVIQTLINSLELSGFFCVCVCWPWCYSLVVTVLEIIFICFFFGGWTMITWVFCRARKRIPGGNNISTLLALCWSWHAFTDSHGPGWETAFVGDVRDASEWLTR